MHCFQLFYENAKGKHHCCSSIILNRIKALDQTIKDKTATLEAMKSEENAIILTKDRCGYQCVRVR